MFFPTKVRALKWFISEAYVRNWRALKLLPSDRKFLACEAARRWKPKSDPEFPDPLVPEKFPHDEKRAATFQPLRRNKMCRRDRELRLWDGDQELGDVETHPAGIRTRPTDCFVAPPQPSFIRLAWDFRVLCGTSGWPFKMGNAATSKKGDPAENGTNIF